MDETTSTKGCARREWERLRRAAPFLEVFEVMGSKFCFCTVTCFFCAIDNAVAAAIEALAAGATFDDTDLRFRADPSQPPLDEVVAELSSLLDGGYLSGDDPLAQGPPDGAAAVTALALIMATSCNLRCRYCYADAGSYHRPQRLMDVATAKSAVDFLLRNSRRAKDVAISFFGGEPLLDYRCIEEVVPYALDRFARTGQSCSFSITTNGTLLTPDRVAFFEKHGFAYIVSLDGPPDVNDRNRIFPDGSGSYHQVIARLTRLEETTPGFRDKVTIRATFTGQDHDLTTCLAHLRQLGFTQIALESCSALPEQLGIANEGVPGILSEYDAAARWYLEQLQAGDRFIFSHMHQLFFQVAEGTRRITQCGAGRGYLAVAPDGVLYPCHRLVGNETYAMGSVFRGADPEMQSVFGKVSVPYKERCRSCWARYICGGGCHATAVQFNGNLLEPYAVECELMRHRIRLGAWIYGQLSEEPSARPRCVASPAVVR